MEATEQAHPRFALGYYIGMFLILFFLLCSLLRHFNDIRLEEALLIIVLAAAILFAVFAAWKATHHGG
jgi:Kef-type K+ transport system membrane component KefB